MTPAFCFPKMTPDMFAAHEAWASFSCAFFRPFYANYMRCALDTMIMVSFFAPMAFGQLAGALTVSILAAILICLTIVPRHSTIAEKEQPYFP